LRTTSAVVDGPSRGRDGNVHFRDLDRGQITIVSHLPAMLPVVVGCALAFRIRGEERVAVGGSAKEPPREGIATKRMNLAAVRRFRSCSSATTTSGPTRRPTHLDTPRERLADRAQAYGFEGVTIDGTDVLAVLPRGPTSRSRRPRR
jgi:TPP-dependent pyruvate/acetoin dehydrogenase alpha subunit